jgi:hypothetical protein
VTNRTWYIADIVALLDASDAAKVQDRAAKREQSYERDGSALCFDM